MVYELLALKFANARDSSALQRELGAAAAHDFVRTAGDLDELKQEVRDVVYEGLRNEAIARIRRCRERIVADRQAQKHKVQCAIHVQALVRKIYWQGI